MWHTYHPEAFRKLMQEDKMEAIQGYAVRLSQTLYVNSVGTQNFVITL